MSENDIQRQILDALLGIGALAFRVQAGQVKVRGGWMHLAPQGTADILVVVPPHGRFLALEVKTAKGKEREAQLRWAEEIRAVGGMVRTVRTVEQALAAYVEARGRKADDETRS